MAKLYARILEERIQEQMEEKMEDSRAGFRRNRSTQDQIYTVRQIIEKAIKQGKDIRLCFIDFEKAFDKVKRVVIWKCMERRGIDNKLIQAVKSYYKKTRNYTQTNNEESKESETIQGVRQGCVLSPLLFNIVTNEVIKECHTKTDGMK